jgi:hypothetical protein
LVLRCVLGLESPFFDSITAFRGLRLRKYLSGSNVASDEAISESGGLGQHVVILVHGIRDYALWQKAIHATVDADGIRVYPAITFSFGY